jgi:type II secretory pathway component PulJ
MRNLRMATKILNQKRGFTIIEFMVAIGLFIVAIYISFGAVVSLFDANNKSQTLFSAMSNLNYAIESMTRDIRFADVYHCGSAGSLSSPADCNGGDTSLAITTSGVTTVYRFSGGQIEKSVGGGSYVPVTGTDVTLQYARFYVVGSAPASSAIGTPGRDSQPFAFLVVKGYSGRKPSSQTNFDIETLVSQKKLDL